MRTAMRTAAGRSIFYADALPTHVYDHAHVRRDLLSKDSMTRVNGGLPQPSSWNPAAPFWILPRPASHPPHPPTDTPSLVADTLLSIVMTRVETNDAVDHVRISEHRSEAHSPRQIQYYVQV